MNTEFSNFPLLRCILYSINIQKIKHKGKIKKEGVTNHKICHTFSEMYRNEQDAKH